MKRKCKAKAVVGMLVSLLVGAVLFAAILVYTPAIAQFSNYNPQGLEASTLDEVLALPDEDIDLATAIMILYKEWDPSFDVTGSLEEIDRMALELEMRISPEDDPEKIASLINQYVFEEKTYSGLGPTSPDYMKKLEDSALPCVLENKKGDCLGLSLLYLTLGERLGLPFYAVAVPKHIFVRYDDGKKRINIETTDEGREYEDSHYEEMFMLHPTYRNYNFYLRNLVKREVIGLFLNNLGGAYYEKGMYDQAIARYKKAIEINPNYAEAHYNLGSVYGDREMFDEAIGEHRKAIETNPNHAEAHGNLGVAYGAKGMLNEAISEFKETLEIDPNDAKAHYNLGVVYGEKGMYDQAIARYKKAIEINPEYTEAHYRLASAYGEKGVLNKVIAELKKTLEINPNYPEAHYNLGLTYGHKGMYDKAIPELKAALEANPNHAEAHFALGVVYDRKGMLDKAIGEYKKTVEVNPSYVEAHFNLGEAYGRKGMLDEAMTEYEKVLEINPNDAKVHNNLAVVYYFTGEYSLAIKHCDKVIELGYRVHPEFLEDLEPYRGK